MLEPDLCIPLRRVVRDFLSWEIGPGAFGTSLFYLLYHSIGIVEAEFTCLAKVFEPFGLLL